MKKLLLMLLLLIGVTYAQKGVLVNGSYVYSDSLKYNEVSPDSVIILQYDFTAEWYRIFLKGNSNSPVDSIGIKFGTVRYTPSATDPRGYSPVDTLWGSYFSTIKDSAFSNASVMVNNTVGKDFFLLAPPIQLVKLKLLNHRATLTTRKVDIVIQAIKK